LLDIALDHTRWMIRRQKPVEINRPTFHLPSLRLPHPGLARSTLFRPAAIFGSTSNNSFCDINASSTIASKESSLSSRHKTKIHEF